MTGPGPSDPSGQAPPPPEPQAPPPAPDASAAAGAAPAGDQWGQQGQTPDWAQKAQNWRPSEVAAGPAAGIAYADLTLRIFAIIIDGLILGIGYSLVRSIFLSQLSFALEFVIGAILYAGVSLLYFMYTWTTMKASLGQRVLGLMTVSETDGSALTQNAAITRWAVLFGPAVVAEVLSFGGFGFGGFALFALSGLLSLAIFAYYIYLVYTAANDPKRQALHDKYAHSVVIKPQAPAS